MFSRNNSFEYNNQSPMDTFLAEFGEETPTMQAPGTPPSSFTLCTSDLDDLGDLTDGGLESPRQLATVLNMSEEEFVNSCNTQPPMDFNASIFSEDEASGEESEVEESEEESDVESEVESTDVDEITVEKLEELVEEYKQKDATNKRKLSEMEERIDDMQAEIEQHMDDKDELHSRLNDGEATDDEADTGVSATRCRECKVASTNSMGKFSELHFYYKDNVCAQHDVEYYCTDCKSESTMRARAVQFMNEDHVDCYGDLSLEFSQKNAIVIPGEKTITFGELKDRPMKRRRVSPKSSNIVPLLVGGEPETKRDTVKCPWGCGFEFRPHGGKFYDPRPLKLHIANPQNGCVHPRMKANTPTKVANNPYSTKHCPVATPGVEALIMHGFKSLKKDRNANWTDSFLKWQCQTCDFKHYHKGRYQEHQKTHVAKC